MSIVAGRIFSGGPIVTIDPLRPEVEALAVIGERIFALGTRAEIARYRGAATEMVDLAGATLMPGFVEAHGHPIMTGAAWGDPVVDIRAIHTPTYAAAVAKIRRRVAKAKPGEFLWFLGLDPALHQGMREPAMAELDALAPNNPLCVQTSNFHVVYANSAALRVVTNADDIPAPKGGQIYKDKATGTRQRGCRGSSRKARRRCCAKPSSKGKGRRASSARRATGCGTTRTRVTRRRPSWDRRPVGRSSWSR